MAVSNKYAVLVGCNYPGTENELHGCVNDVLRMEDTLLTRFRFSNDNIQTLIDTDTAHYKNATGKNVRDALDELVAKASPGDVLFFYYSGHGTQNPSAADDTGFDEAIVPTDFNFITDDDFRTLVNKVPRGSSFVIVADSCFSGGLIDKEKEQIGPHHPTGAANKTVPSSSSMKGRYLPPDILLKVLKKMCGDENVQFSDLNEAVMKVFGEDASRSIRNRNRKRARVDDAEMGILLSGCQGDELSADVNPDDNDYSKACGAFSDSIEKVLASHPKPITNKDLVTECRKLLAQQTTDQDHFTQHPCLYCSDSNADAVFLSET